MKKISEDEFKLRAKNFLISIEIIKYNGFNKKSLFKCLKHGNFYKTPKNFLIHQCNECTKEKLHNIYSKDKSVFIKQAKKIFPYYNYSKVNYYNDASEIIVECPKHKEFRTTPNRILSGHECPVCANLKRISSKTYTIEELIKRANIIHNNKYNYSKANNNGIFNTIEIICPIHNSFFMTWNNHINCKQNCPKCYSSFGETEVENYLNKNKITFKKPMKYNDLKDVNNLSYDFYLPDKNILIECQGQQHYYNSFNKPLHEFHKQLHHDWLKRKYAIKNGITLLVIPYWEYKNINNILEEKI